MLLSPSHWKDFRANTPLKWGETKFQKSNGKQVPNDTPGVYTFVIRPEIAAHPACSYLMYVGKAQKQSLRKRYKQYFTEQDDSSDRVHVTKMLRLWRKHLWFYYAPIKDPTKIDAAEQALMNAFLPPVNRSYRGVVSRQLSFLF